MWVRFGVTRLALELLMSSYAHDFYRSNQIMTVGKKKNSIASMFFFFISLNFPRFVSSPTILISARVPNLHSALFSGCPQPSISPSHPSPYVAVATFSFSSSPPITCTGDVSQFPIRWELVTWSDISSVKNTRALIKTLKRCDTLLHRDGQPDWI